MHNSGHFPYSELLIKAGGGRIRQIDRSKASVEYGSSPNYPPRKLRMLWDPAEILVGS